MGSRRKSRELALQMLFQYDLSGNDPEAIILTFDDLQKAKPAIRDFAIRIFLGTIKHLEELDELIVKQADNWRLSRMAVVTATSSGCRSTNSSTRRTPRNW